MHFWGFEACVTNGDLCLQSHLFLRIIIVPEFFRWTAEFFCGDRFHFNFFDTGGRVDYAFLFGILLFFLVVVFVSDIIVLGLKLFGRQKKYC